MQQKNRLISCIIYLIMVFMAGYITSHTVQIAQLLDRQNTHSSYILKMLDGSMEKPYVNRALLPFAAKAIQSLTPTAIEASINARVQGAPYPAMLVVVMMFAALVVYSFTLASLWRIFFPSYAWLAPCMSILGLGAITGFVDENATLYDFPTLALSALCLRFLIEKKWRHYLACFALACANKETAFLLIGLYVLLNRENLRQSFYRRLLWLQCAIYAVIIGTIHAHFAASAGSNFVFRPSWILPIFFGDFQNGLHLIVLAVLAGLISSCWNELPESLRRSLWLVPGMVMLYYGFGRQGEYRVFYEVFPSLTLATGFSIFCLLFPQKIGHDRS